MKYWLLKSEPNVWSIEHQKKAGSLPSMKLYQALVKE